MDRFFEVIEKIMDRVCTVVSFFSLLIMAIITFEVIARYAFNSPTSWAWLINKQVFLVITLFGGTYAFLRNAHIRIEMFYERFPSKGRLIIKIFTLILFVSFTVALIWKGGVMAKQAISVHEKAVGLFRLPIYPFKALIPIAAFLFLVQGVISILKKSDD